MIFLHVVERELRVAARRQATYGVRWIGSFLAVILGGLFLLPSLIIPRMFGGLLYPDGSRLLELLLFLGLATALISGVVLTADCLSRERREGTLGLLFLTDLRGIDIVTGKLAAQALIPLQALLAAFPVAALTLAMGGVTGAEFWRAQLALLNTLFLALSIGMLVSSFATEDNTALAAAVAVLAGLTFLPMLAAGFFSLKALALASPGALVFAALDRAGATPSHHDFYRALALQHAAAWLALVTAGAVIHRTWRTGREPSLRRSTPTPALSAPRTHARRSARLGDGNPFAWLSRRSRGSTVAVRCIALGPLVIGGAVFIFNPGTDGFPVVQGLSALGMFLLKLVVTAHVTFFLHQLYRDGAAELLLVTALTNRELLEGHLQALRRLVVWPFILLGLLQIGAAAGHSLSMAGDWPSTGLMILSAVTLPLIGLIIDGLDLIAVTYHASRWATLQDRPWKTILRTFLLILVLPSLFCWVGRLIVDLIVIGRYRPELESFRRCLMRRLLPPEETRGPVAPPVLKA